MHDFYNPEPTKMKRNQCLKLSVHPAPEMHDFLSGVWIFRASA